MVRLISRQHGGLAVLKLTKLFGIDYFPAAKDSGKVLNIIIYCHLIIIIGLTFSEQFLTRKTYIVTSEKSCRPNSHTNNNWAQMQSIREGRFVPTASLWWSWLWKSASRGCARAQLIRRNNCTPRRSNHVSTTSIARRLTGEIGKTNFQAQERGRHQRKSEKHLWEGT